MPIGKTELVLIVAALTYFVLLFFWLYREQQRSTGEQRKFFKVLTEAFISNSLNTNQDLINLYKGVRKLSPEDLTFRSGLTRWLREFIVDLYDRKYVYSLKVDQVAHLNERISELIAANESVSPYADLPDVERNLAADIAAMTEGEHKEEVLRKLAELASTIQTREDALIRSRSLTRWSVPLALMGLALTIIFGCLALLR